MKGAHKSYMFGASDKTQYFNITYSEKFQGGEEEAD